MDSGLLSLVDANAWSFGPVATAWRLAQLTLRQGEAPGRVWEPLIQGCLRMNPLATWLGQAPVGSPLPAALGADLMLRQANLITRALDILAPSTRVLLVGHDAEVTRLFELESSHREYRYLLLDGPSGAPPPGASVHTPAGFSGTLLDPMHFNELEQALDWADSVVLSGFLVHRFNLLGPAQLRPLLVSAREQVDRLVLFAPRERDIEFGCGTPTRYTDDFRPCWWSQLVTHRVDDSALDADDSEPQPLTRRLPA